MISNHDFWWKVWFETNTTVINSVLYIWTFSSTGINGTIFLSDFKCGQLLEMEMEMGTSWHQGNASFQKCFHL